MASSDSSLSYRRIRAPKNHGEVLHLPAADEWSALWDSNLTVDLGQANFSPSLQQIRQSGRKEIVAAAFEFTQQYRDTNLSNRNHNQILMAGHQPTLFHAGVWYKNFVLSSYAARINALPINLIVDNDACQNTFINLPDKYGKLQKINFDESGSTLPYEERIILNPDLFTSFQPTSSKAVKHLVGQPIVNKLWPYVTSNRSNPNLGHAIATGRHRLESDIGLQTLELPISLLAQTQSFATFTIELINRFSDFHRIYNETVESYRKIHKIKNQYQPVPNLRTSDQWLETPLWIWTKENPVRRSLFAKKIKDGSFELSDLENITVTIPAKSNCEDYLAILGNRIKIRPKALITTMFSRLIASDMFVHGIGGAKYDQLTDEIAARFFNVQLPGYLTVTGTFRIQDQIPNIADTEISSLRHSLREQKFHPEQFLAHDRTETQKWVQQKREWFEMELPRGQRLQRHNAITELNGKLANENAKQQSEIQNRIEEMVKQKPAARVFNSREFSFCLFNSENTDLLQELASSASNQTN